jgi:LysM repeat protein
MHVIMPGETLYGLSKKYHTSIPELLQLNPFITDNNLPAGDTIKIPVSSEVVPSDEAHQKKLQHSILYTVPKKETLYSISKKYNTDVETLMLWNDLQESDIKEGQVLIVGYETPDLKIVGPLPIGTKLPGSASENFPEARENETDKEKPGTLNETTSKVTSGGINNSSDNDSAISQKGIATWVRSGSDDGNFYALHPDAAKGTEINVTNLMNGRTVMVKVIGKLPATSENENVLIKISGSAAKKLGVLDEKFLAELSYIGIQQNNNSEISKPH